MLDIVHKFLPAGIGYLFGKIRQNSHQPLRRLLASDKDRKLFPFHNRYSFGKRYTEHRGKLLAKFLNFCRIFRHDRPEQCYRRKTEPVRNNLIYNNFAPKTDARHIIKYYLFRYHISPRIESALFHRRTKDRSRCNRNCTNIDWQLRYRRRELIPRKDPCRRLRLCMSRHH